MREHLVNATEFEGLPIRATKGQRWLALLICAASLGVLSVAAWLDPNPTGYGSHTQLGFSSCFWISRAEMPCPTCGMSTAFAFAAEGKLIQSFLAQPMGFLLSILTVMTFWMAGHAALTGSRVAFLLLRLWRPSVIWFFAGLTLASWIYKIISFRMSV